MESKRYNLTFVSGAGMIETKTNVRLKEIGANYVIVIGVNGKESILMNTFIKLDEV